MLDERQAGRSKFVWKYIGTSCRRSNRTSTSPLGPSPGMQHILALQLVMALIPAALSRRV